MKQQVNGYILYANYYTKIKKTATIKYKPAIPIYSSYNMKIHLNALLSTLYLCITYYKIILTI